jgi:hypothetical protein
LFEGEKVLKNKKNVYLIADDLSCNEWVIIFFILVAELYLVQAPIPAPVPAPVPQHSFDRT